MRAAIVIAVTILGFAGAAAAAESGATPTAATASSASAPMNVLLTVARTCTVGTLDSKVTLQCSRGVSTVSVHSASTGAPEVRPLVSGTNVVSATDPKASSRSPQALVVLNF